MNEVKSNLMDSTMRVDPTNPNLNRFSESVYKSESKIGPDGQPIRELY